MNEPKENLRTKKTTRVLPARACAQGRSASKPDPFKQSQRLPLLSGLQAGLPLKIFRHPTALNWRIFIDSEL